jgi:hypothetical protein
MKKGKTFLEKLTWCITQEEIHQVEISSPDIDDAIKGHEEVHSFDDDSIVPNPREE